ncbi:hypothetical protein ABK905_24490 [Acerihabitans sp. KWT182]|uniref:Uncharacterized protein n=1 Tax=Acerihabitans sp. KWT182 TaxID=3157919 RepID=A0AAU7Q8T7_9GAMM
MMTDRRAGGWRLTLIVLLLSASQALGAPENAGRNPFAPEPVNRERGADGTPVKGVVGDGECWHIWSTDKQGRWHKRLAADFSAPGLATILDKDEKG